MNRFLTVLFVLACLHTGWRYFSTEKSSEPSRYSKSSDISAEGLAQLAATVKPGDVTMYSTTECQYCAQAKGWLNQYGFAFSECNMSVREECEREFKSFGANGTPYLVVRGHHMKDGFDSDEFVALLSH